MSKIVALESKLKIKVITINLLVHQTEQAVNLVIRIRLIIILIEIS